MTQSIINEYFEDLATSFVPISHNPTSHKRFSVVDDDVISDAIKRDLDFSSWCMLIEEVGPQIRANESKHFNEYYTFRFTICKNVSREKPDVSRIKETSMQYAKAIFARIIRDYHEKKKFNSTPFKLENIEFKASFEYYQNILEEDLLGTDCSITIHQPFDCHKIDPTLWN